MDPEFFALEDATWWKVYTATTGAYSVLAEIRKTVPGAEFIARNLAERLNKQQKKAA